MLQKVLQVILNPRYLLRGIKAAAYYKKIPGSFLPGSNSGLFKIPDGTNPVCVVLIVVVLVAIVEILVPRVISIVLRRAPIVIISETANSEKVKAF